MNIKQSVGIFQNNVARLGIMKSRNTETCSFADDLMNSLSVVNDNDMVNFDAASRFSINDLSEKGLKELFDSFMPAEYAARRKKKARQLKPILRKFDPVMTEEEILKEEGFPVRE